MKTSSFDYEISDDKSLLQIEVIHRLLKDTYWCREIPLETVERSIKGSTCFGVYRKGIQIGFARVITDQATFAWLCDVVIDETFRYQGLGQELMKFMSTTTTHIHDGILLIQFFENRPIAVRERMVDVPADQVPEETRMLH